MSGKMFISIISKNRKRHKLHFGSFIVGDILIEKEILL